MVYKLVHGVLYSFVGWLVPGVKCWSATRRSTGHFGDDVLKIWWSNQQCQSTEGGWLVIQTGLRLTRLTSTCYNNTTVDACTYSTRQWKHKQI